MRFAAKMANRQVNEEERLINQLVKCRLNRMIIFRPVIHFLLHIFSFRNLKKMSEAELVSAYKGSEDLNYLGELYQRKAVMISSICVKYMDRTEDAEDAAIEIFEILKKDLLKHEVDNLNGWLFSVTRNHCYKKLNKLKREGTVLSDDEKSLNHFMESGQDDSLNDKMLKEAELELMEEAIDQLKDEQKLCIELFYLKQKSYKEIEEETQLDLKKVKSHIQNGKRNIKIWMEKHQKDLE
jgi:RNA polymerase sigma-70 factor (ECF subfamily)